MQATITYLFTEQAQRAQMAATGQPVARKQTMTIDVAPEAIPLFPVDNDGVITVDLTGPSAAFSGIAQQIQLSREVEEWNGGGGIAFRSPSPDIVAMARKGMEQKKRESQQRALELGANGEHNRRITEEAYQRFLADPNARLSTLRIEGQRYPADWSASNHVAFAAEVDRRNRADAEAKKAAEEARENAKQQFVAEWIANHAPEEVRQQFTDGLLCRSVALNMIADAAFTAAGVPEPAEYDDDFCRDSSCPCGDKRLECLPCGVYPAWRKLKAGLPEGFAVEFHRVRECRREEAESYGWPDEETASDPMYLAHVTIPHGPFQFERTVRL